MEQTTHAGTNDSGFAAQLKKVLLAGVGAVVLAQEEIEEFVNRLVKKGEMAEKDGRKLVAEILARRKKEVERGVADLESDWSSRVQKLLHRMHVASKTDIASLEKRIEELSKKLDRLASHPRK
jgi:poly(hydroxyalkanoate) granule-associated protein